MEDMDPDSLGDSGAAAHHAAAKPPRAAGTAHHSHHWHWQGPVAKEQTHSANSLNIQFK